MIYKQETTGNNFLPKPTREIILEIELNGKIRFDILLYTIYNHYNVSYKIVNANIEYLNGSNFGNVKLLLNITQDQINKIESYLREYKLLSSKIDVLQKKEAS
ncbi:NIL domain-containing protein [Epilithonimonas hungarica]|uniref:NIL domain-containing protein n=1 Tax=Epilithonimonas hungarica TaxID=454006 RepID=A0A1G7N3I9_9FLAO|nr:NIL domain-containing protein [Epilithonimonas hungarica]MDP9954580.1 ABC-type methionine transport system ATPase subunit [Epilithonimonas hungarica]MPT33257.1 cysteine methyltransferase [Chryseobacterium sp.]SDF68467.1 NIL domain-containing protein [Epilithonimonas hungarica]